MLVCVTQQPKETKVTYVHTQIQLGVALFNVFVFFCFLLFILFFLVFCLANDRHKQIRTYIHTSKSLPQTLNTMHRAAD